jgi:hypothetical protein
MLALGLALLLATLPPVAAECHMDDAAGEPFPVCFDPGDGLLLGSGVQSRDGVVETSLRLGLLVRSGRASRSKGTPWFNAHRFVQTEALLAPGRRGVSLTLYEASLRRHLEEGFILIPTARPVRIPFPFDLTMALRAGHWERRFWEGPGWTLETGRAALLLDPVRSDTERAWLGLGPAASHVLRRTPDGLVQELTPFTSLMLDAGYETENGWWALRASGLAGWSYGLDGETRFRARAEASLERLLVALNDEPVWLRVSGAYVRGDAGVARGTEWTAGVGLVVRAFSAR